MKNDNFCVNAIRVLSMDQIDAAKSGHPGIALGAAPILYALYSRVLKVTPQNQKHLLRDRFVMSAGHGSALLYATLHACGFNFSVDDLKSKQAFSKVLENKVFKRFIVLSSRNGPGTIEGIYDENFRCINYWLKLF